MRPKIAIIGDGIGGPAAAVALAARAWPLRSMSKRQC